MRIRQMPGRLALLVLLSCLLAAAPGVVLGDGGFAKIYSPYGTWEEMARSPRSEALGGSDMAMAGGPFASLSNAAPLPEGNGVSLGYGFFDYSPYSIAVFDVSYAVRSLGVAAEYGPWRISAVGVRQTSDGYVIRTAYNPEGTLDESEDNLVLLNGSADLSWLFLPRLANFRWTLGAGGRYHETSQFGITSDAWDLDLGTSARLSRPFRRGRLEYGVSVMLRNATNESISYNNMDRTLPRFRDLGVAATLVQDFTGLPGDDLRIQLTYANRKDQVADEEGFFGDDRYGIELTAREILTLRAGHDNRRNPEKKWSYGLGISLLPDRISDSFDLNYDYAHLSDFEDEYEVYNGERDTHSFTLRYHF